MDNPHLKPLLPANAALLVVDYQDKLLPAIHEADKAVEAGRRMIEAAKVLSVPILGTEQYPAGLGGTCGIIAQAMHGWPIFQKTRFSGCVPAVMEEIARLNRPDIVVVGIEAHVCVLQTVLDLLRAAKRTIVCADAISSRRPLDRDIAITRMRDCGAVVTTTESVTFEWLSEANTDQFRRVLKIVK